MKLARRFNEPRRHPVGFFFGRDRWHRAGAAPDGLGGTISARPAWFTGVFGLGHCSRQGPLRPAESAQESVAFLPNNREQTSTNKDLL